MGRVPLTTGDQAGGTVYDPFFGSGTALIAAERTGTTCHGTEIDPVSWR